MRAVALFQSINQNQAAPAAISFQKIPLISGALSYDKFSFIRNGSSGTMPCMTPIVQLSKKLDAIEEKIGYHFKDRALLLQAFVHRSYINEHRDIDKHNERLEFLGDSILGVLISDYLFRSLPETPEGILSSLRAKLVDSAACICYIQKLDLEKHLLLGRGERMNSGRGRESILANLFEAIIGAVYVDGGITAASYFLFLNFSEEIDSTIKAPQQNSKALLQDFCQKKFQQPPFYRIMEESGPDHNKTFLITVTINDTELGKGTGASKKEAQQAAASNALSFLQVGR